VSRRLAILAALGVALAGCPGRPKAVVYDLASRVLVAETWSAADVLRFGTPAAEPRLTEGFHREAGGAEEPFLWSKGEAEVGFRWDAVGPRVAILDAAPYRGVGEQSAERLRVVSEHLRRVARIDDPPRQLDLEEVTLDFFWVLSPAPARGEQ
jgi:hypothetical protein